MKNTTISTSTGKKTVSLITAVIMIITAVLVILPPAKASAEPYNIAFVLPNDKSYQVSVFDRYSWGSDHKSYIAEWVRHKGDTMPGGVMDIATKNGTEVYALADGIIYHNCWSPNGGYLVVIEHTFNGLKYYSYYGHLRSKSDISVGKKVSAGQRIAYTGSSGHIHFETNLIDAYCVWSQLMGIDISVMPNSGASKYNSHADHNLKPSANDGEEVYVQDGTYRIVTADSGYCVDVYRGNQQSVEDGRNVQCFSKNYSGAQIFKFIRQSDGWYIIQHANTGMFLDMNGENGNVYVWTPNYSDYQKWKLIKNGDGYYLLHKGSNKYLDISGEKYVNENNIQGWTKNSTSAQRFYLVAETVGRVKNTDGTLVVHSKKNYYDSSAIGYVCENQLVTVLWREGSFAYIRYDTNSEGYVCGKYVKDV